MLDRKYYDTYNQLAQMALLLPSRRVMFKCKNNKCNHTWTRDYADNHGWLYRVANEGIYRLNERGKDEDKECPKCGTNWVKHNAVLGTFVKTKLCDDRCLNAVSHVCNCSCGGKNHGGGHLLTKELQCVSN